MSNNIRNSGIKAIDEVRWGSCIAHLFSTKEDYFQIVIPYIQAGLADDELCIWIYSDNTQYQEIISRLKSSNITNVDKYIDSGQLMLVHYEEWYLKDGTYNKIRDNGQWKRLTQYALNSRFIGIRIAVDLTWTVEKHVDDFSNYKNKFNEIMYEVPFLAMSLYDVNSLNMLQTVQVVNDHNYTIIKRKDQFEVIKNIKLLTNEEDLDPSEQGFKKILEILPVSVFMYDENRIYYCNENAMGLLGFKDFNGQGENLSLIDFVSDKAGLYRHIRQIINGDDEVYYYICELYSANVEGKLVEMVSKKYSYQGQPIVLSVIQDMNSSRMINKSEPSYSLEQEKYRTDFFATISHELRTPLNVILGTLQLLEMESSTYKERCKYKKHISIMKKNCLRLLRLVNNIIDLFRLDFNCYEIRKQNCNIVKIIEDTTLSAVEHAKEKDISVIFDTDIEEKIMACDPIQIERIMLNLLSNAIKYTPRKGNILVSVRDNMDKVEIVVKDNGIGISKEKQKIIFDKFVQADESFTRPYEGSGIGLSIVKALVERHNGNITVNSDLGRGSEFIVELPCELLDDADNHQNEPVQSNYIYNCYNGIKSINVEFSDLY
jgi:signal transduction histidine kinase